MIVMMNNYYICIFVILQNSSIFSIKHKFKFIIDTNMSIIDFIAIGPTVIALTQDGYLIAWDHAPSRNFNK